MLFKILQARIESRQGQPGKALALFRDAYESDISSLSAITYYAEELGQQGKYSEARKVLRKAVRTFTKSVRFYEMLSHAENEHGSPMESHRALSNAYALVGNYASAIQQLNIARSLANKDDFYIQASITARIKELKTLEALEKKNN